MQNILHEVTKDMTRQVFIRQGDSSNIREVLKEAKSKSWTNIIVDMNISNTAILLRTVGVISLGYPENKLLFFKVKITEFYFLERTLFLTTWCTYIHLFSSMEKLDMVFRKNQNAFGVKFSGREKFI